VIDRGELDRRFGRSAVRIEGGAIFDSIPLAMSLTVRQLEVFLAVAECRSFRRAAERLGVSQPSVSGRIRSLESYLGYDLFDRSNGGTPRLTSEGTAFVARARQLVEGASALLTARPSRPARSSRRLRVFVGPLLLKRRVLRQLTAFCCENPDLGVDFLPASSVTNGREIVRNGEADVVLYTGEPPEEPGVDVEIIARTKWSIYGTPELLARIETHASAVTNAPFILPPEHYPAASWIRRRLAEVDISPENIVCRPQFPDVTEQMMIQGRGLSVFFDEFAFDSGLRKIGPDLVPASRVMLLGPRAREAEAAPLLTFLRTACSVSPAFRCQ